MNNITYDILTNDVKYMLDTLVEEDIYHPLNNGDFALISKKITKSFKRLYLEYLIYKNPSFSSEKLYIQCLSHWAYSGMEARDIINGKIGKLIEYMPEHDLCIYKIDAKDTFKYILIHKKYNSILGYINLSIENNTATLLNIYGGNLGWGWDSLKIFLDKWFIPKYGVTIKDNHLTKLLK
jgi:hypothetical protein